MFLIFTQSEEGGVDTATLSRHAEQFFGATLTLLERGRGGGRDAKPWRFAMKSTRGAYDATFVLRTRKVESSDLRAARDAEARGGVVGMEALASDCAHVWELDADDATTSHASYAMCAVLASVALGPIMPPEHDALLGVRAARERAEQGDETFRSPPRP